MINVIKLTIIFDITLYIAFKSTDCRIINIFGVLTKNDDILSHKF